MKNVMSVLLVTGLAATWVGCQSANDSKVIPGDESSESGVTLVTLKVPNMV